jgi:hypothetical protein
MYPPIPAIAARVQRRIPATPNAPLEVATIPPVSNQSQSARRFFGFQCQYCFNLPRGLFVES